MCGMQKIHRKTCKNCYSIPVPTTIEYGNFRNHSSLNFTFLINVLLAIFHYISNVKKLYIFAVYNINYLQYSFTSSSGKGKKSVDSCDKSPSAATSTLTTKPNTSCKEVTEVVYASVASLEEGDTARSAARKAVEALQRRAYILIFLPGP